MTTFVPAESPCHPLAILGPMWLNIAWKKPWAWRLSTRYFLNCTFCHKYQEIQNVRRSCHRYNRGWDSIFFSSDLLIFLPFCLLRLTKRNKDQPQPWRSRQGFSHRQRAPSCCTAPARFLGVGTETTWMIKKDEINKIIKIIEVESVLILIRVSVLVILLVQPLIYCWFFVEAFSWRPIRGCS